MYLLNHLTFRTSLRARPPLKQLKCSYRPSREQTPAPALALEGGGREGGMGWDGWDGRWERRMDGMVGGKDGWDGMGWMGWWEGRMGWDGMRWDGIQG